MTDAIRPLIAGNWKMNGLKSSFAEFDAMLAGAGDVAAKADLLVCPPATLVGAFADKARGSKVAVGAQDCHPKASGAHTGDLSAEMFKDLGATVGDKLNIRAASGATRVLTISGLVDLGNKGVNQRVCYVALRTGQSLLGMIGGITTIDVTVTDIYAA